MTATRILGKLIGPALLLPAVVPVVAAVAISGAFTGGGTRRWGRGRVEDLREEARRAQGETAEAFYELELAQRGMQLSLETIRAVDDGPQARKAFADHAAFAERIDRANHEYISLMDSHDVESADLDATTASRARHDFTRMRDELRRAKEDLERFGQSLAPLVERAEQELARVAPAVERAKRALLEATRALDTVREAGLDAGDSAADLAALAPELRLLNEGAARHGVQPTLTRAEEVTRRAGEITARMTELPRRAEEVGRRLTSLRTRAEAITTRAGQVGPTLSELRRRFSAACWQDLQRVPDEAAEAVAGARRTLDGVERARREQRWDDAADGITEAQALLARTDELVSTAGDRLRRLNEVSFDASKEIERTRFAVRDAQRLAMVGRAVPEPRHAERLDGAVERLDAAVAALERGGRNPDYWRFLMETKAVRDIAGAVVEDIRGKGR
ncbi:hypothetical protein GCM10027160_36020 [Streptomyces calidiresistens]|uniref:Septation ring formation regulator EzrA n=1 Tax=Streptomyces calidiresistens TaxID=1485586 RepID=A0A7W3T7L8_9ACTN|nr:hypothetical protein [Streptomyces calidiresistens]MBB0232407.1 hypothetical protein [Streptomyces calidiresistens]